MSTAFEVLAEPTRRRILDLLLVRPRLVGELTDVLGLSQPGASKHLKVLREAGLICGERRGTWVYYRVEPDALARLSAVLVPDTAAVARA